MTNNKGLLQRVYDAVLNRQEKPAESRANYLSDDGGVYSYNAGMPSFQGGKIKEYKDKASQVTANKGWVFAANDFIAEAFSGVEFQLVKTDRNGNRQTITEHPILSLLQSPTDSQHGMQMLYLHASYLNINGESYIVPTGENTEMRGLPAALTVLPAHLVEYKINKDTGDEIMRYGDYYWMNTDRERQFYRDYRPNPASPRNGMSVIQAAAGAVDTDDKAVDYNQRFFANSARPSMIIESEKQMTDVAFRRLKQQLIEFYSGGQNAYVPMILGGGASAKQFVLTQRDMDFLEGRKLSRDEILAMFRVSPALLGMITSANRANMEAAEYHFAKYTLLPRVRAFCNFINKYVIDPFDPSLELTFVDFIPSDSSVEASANTAAINNWMTVNEVRKTLDLPPIEGGDVLYRPSGRVEIGKSEESQPAPKTEDKEPEAADSDEDKEQGNKEQDDKKLADEAKKRARRELAVMLKRAADQKKKRVEKRAADRFQQGEKRVADMQPRLDKYEASFRKAARKHFEAQRKAVIEELNEVEDGNRSLAKRDIDPVYKQLALIMSDEQWDINLQDALMPLYTTLMKEQIKDAWAQLPNFKPPKDVPAVSEFVKQRARKIAVDINDESQKQILLTLAEGIDKGESRNELRARVENIFGDMSSKRADRIARTESVRAASQADIYGWDDSDIVTGKEWHTKLGDACPFCQSLNGKIVELNKPFVELGDRLEVTTTSKAGNPVTHTLKVDYEPMVGPPSHPNCRCVLLPVIVDQN